MKKPLDSTLSRRTTLKLLVSAVGAAAAVPLVGRAATARVDSKPRSYGTVAKSALQYQDHPKGTSACARCANFMPGPKPDASGHCTIVAGDISPKGWCLAYADNG